jgi:polyhydroxyalkanoate synthesis regulator phasin
MAGLGDFVQKAFYLGVGIAASAGEKASDVKAQAQKLADEMVAKGEINADEARKMVEGMLQSAQQAQVKPGQTEAAQPKEPRKIEIQDEQSATGDPKVSSMQQQVADLQQELERLKKQS